MTVLARRVASIPARTAGDTWRLIVDLLAPSGTTAHTTLAAAANVASLLIAEEYTATGPIVVVPATGPRVRIYTVHGESAVDDDLNETALPVHPTHAPGWTLSLPCGPDDLAAAQQALAGAPGVTVRALDAGVGGELAKPIGAAAASPRELGGIVIDLNGGF
ncbi:hypothetical protein [Geodermatophilus sp. DSM 44513]|uniref:hypothetical protein n=1 Tax=Geodermatophilus sp. DSM 44513 TaxID=1528104 RepID=UPI00127EC403|nr:hypothetical protein [Geodermatophilus sp. DSM 44513]WNV74351.1 hypothetical protein RTG05_15310 [Geodermatophilus sp. DSM 44513]